MPYEPTSLVDLFRSEVATHTASIAAGLDALAAGTVLDARQLEPLAMAAHSIKGAARIVGIAAASDVAAGLEACLDNARDGKITLGLEAIAALRRGVELIREAAAAPEDGAETWAAGRRDLLKTSLHDLAQIAAGRVVVPAPAVAARPPPTTMPALARVDASLLDLFRMEAESHGAALSEGLLALERDPGHADLLNQLMRAAHSIKGAARIVNVEPAVALAHVMEDCFIASLEGKAVLGADDIDLLLRATDLVLLIARNGGGDDRQVADLASRLAAVLQRPLPTERLPVAEAEPAPAIADDAAAARTGGSDRAVRVTVQNINRLMNLAGESLVEVRRLEPFAGALHKLSVRQRGLADMLDDLQHVLQDGGADPHTLGLLADAKARALECRQALGTRMGELDAYARRAEDLTGRLYREAIACRMRPFADGLQGFPRMVRDLSRKLGKKVELTVIGDTVGVDRDILEKLEAPLNHMLRNAIDHGLESPAERRAADKPERGTLRLEARHWAGMLSVTVADDGRGIDPAKVRDRIVKRGLVEADVAHSLTDLEVLDYVFVPGFSTAENVTEISGRGVGLDVVRSVAQEVGGSVRVSSELGKGASIHLQLPITLSVIRAVVVEIAGEPYAFPMMRIDRIVAVPLSEIRTLENLQYFVLEGKSVGLVPARQVLDVDGPVPAASDTVAVVVLSDRTRLCGVAVDRFLGEHDLVVRPLDPRLGKVADVSAASVLTDGSPLLILDVEDLVRSIIRLLQGGHLGKVGRGEVVQRKKKRILIVDDSITVREVQRQILANRGYHVDVAVDGIDGWHALRNSDFDLVISDVDMPRMNGIELVRSIKQDPRLRDVPVMIVSYKDRDEDRRRGRRRGQLRPGLRGDGGGRARRGQHPGARAARRPRR
jgi:two-component system sensor histidine kinase and response regulator WspE